jgi:chloramphenicol-sensitive protein RarD
MTADQNDLRRGFVHAALAYAIWGLIPLYFLLMVQVSPLEVVANRIVWSFALLMVVLAVRREMGAFALTLQTPRLLAALSVSALLIGANWLVYIWAVTHHHVLAASLGYFLNPLVNVILGVTLLRERLSAVQCVAIAFAGGGVAVLAMAAPESLGIALTLALSFAAYGLVRKLTPVSALGGLGVETLVLTPLAAAVLIWMATHGALHFGGTPGVTALLLASGVITSVPLLLFASGARKLPMVTLGLLQYLSPTIQFVLAVVFLGETLSPQRWASFALIWTGLAIFAGHAVREGYRRRGARAAAEAPLTGTPG